MAFARAGYGEPSFTCGRRYTVRCGRNTPGTFGNSVGGSDPDSGPAVGKKFGRWGELMAEAARHPQIWCKISGLGTTSGKINVWTAGDIKPYVAYVLDRFGPDRCVCGGDWPVSLLAGSYAYTWQTYREVIDELLPPTQQAAVYSRNAKAFYNLGVEK